MRADSDRKSLLPRVRDLFLLLVVLVHLVQVVEWLDAGTALWPHRSVAAAALLASLAWGVALHRRGRASLLLDVLLVAAIVGAGWGLGYPNSVIALLVGVSQLRALYGERGAGVRGISGILLAYVALAFVFGGVDGLLDPGVVVVVVGLGAIALVIRLVGEVLASHDLASRWDAVLTEATEELLGATDMETIERCVDGALQRLERVAPQAGGGLWAQTVPTGAVPRSAAELTDAAERRELAETAPRLARVLRRLDGDRRLARERVASERRFRVLAEESGDAIYVLELGAWPVWRYLNPAAQRLLGVSSEEARRDPEVVFERIHPEDRSLVFRAGGEDGVIEAPVRFRLVRQSDDQVTWLEVREVVLERSGGHPHVVQGVARDVTRQWSEEVALRRALQQQERAAEELRALDEMKSMFLRAVSHELRTPLTAVLGAAMTLQRRRELSDEQADALLDAINRQAHRLERLLEDLLNVDRLSRGDVEPERSPTDLVALVHRVVAAFEDESHPVSVVGGDVVVDVDAPKVERIVDNLLRNAGKHTPPGTPIRVEVTAEDGGAVLSVEDEGPGVPPELRRRVFEPFAQGQNVREVASPGTGIGLALVSKLAEIHGGQAWIEDPPAGGARFVVTLPGTSTMRAGNVALSRFAPD
jgi:PAS domain S-box-containing protein